MLRIRLSPINTHGRKPALEVQANHAPGPETKADSEINSKEERDDAVIETSPGEKHATEDVLGTKPMLGSITRKISVDDGSDIHGPNVRHDDRPRPPASNARNTKPKQYPSREHETRRGQRCRRATCTEQGKCK